jgi:uncharacterized membrane protein YheB (UPF0754 family)
MQARQKKTDTMLAHVLISQVHNTIQTLSKKKLLNNMTAKALQDSFSLSILITQFVVTCNTK